MYLLDTNICIYLMKNTYPKMADKLFSYQPELFAISSVTVYELAYGAAKSNWGERSKNNMAMFLAPFTIIPFSSEDGMTAGYIRSYLEKEGKLIGPYDLQIAAQALTRNMILITHNTKEFIRVPGLKIEDWTES